MRAARVMVQKQYAGLLEENENGYQFQYDSEYLRGDHPLAISLTLPVREDAYESNVLFPFFDGLIPEGWLLDAVIHNWKLDRNDRFGLLLSSCRDCIGDVQIIPVTEDREGKLR